MYSSVFTDLMRQYDKLRDKAAALYATRRDELYQKCPRIKEIDEQLSLTGVRLSKMVLSGASDTKTSALKLKTESLALNAEKAGLMEELGYTGDYLKDIYECMQCRDTGFIGSSRCKCLKQKLIDRYYDLSGLSKVLEQENFERFDFKYYSPEPNAVTGVSPLANMRMVYATCERFTANFDTAGDNLLFYGDTGLGKTYLCNCIAKRLMDNGRTVLYVTAPQLFKKYEDYRFNKSELERSDERMEMIFDAELLIIDDLGSEFYSIVTNSELFNIINTRVLEKRRTIISSNLSLDEFQKTYSDRIVSRLFGNFKMLKFFGEDIRVKKKLMHLGSLDNKEQ